MSSKKQTGSPRPAAVGSNPAHSKRNNVTCTRCLDKGYIVVASSQNSKHNTNEHTIYACAACKTGSLVNKLNFASFTGPGTVADDPQLNSIDTMAVKQNNKIKSDARPMSAIEAQIALIAYNLTQ